MIADDGSVAAAIVAERSHIGSRVNLARIAALACWVVLAIVLGLGGRREWLTPLPALAVWLAIALVLWAARVRVYLWLVVPLVDVPMVGLVQSWFLEVSTRPQTVAIFTVGIFASLVFVSQLAFSLRSVVLTTIGAVFCTAIVLARAGLPLPNLLSSALLLAWAASVAIFSGSRVGNLVATIARARRTRETELTELVATRTLELSARNVELEQALANVAKAQADLVRAERMASIATLVQGIAHELNNPIGYIAGNVPPLQRYTRFLSAAATTLGDGRARSPEEVRVIAQLDAKHDIAFVAADLATLTDDIAEGARRAKLIVGDLQRLTSGSNRDVELVDLGRMISQTRALFVPRLATGVTLTATIEAVPPVRARAGELEQVLVNLVDNALRAIGAVGVVAITLVREGGELVLAVRDDGHGMPEAVQKRALEPFFTTRTAGEGAGLGLAIAASIVEAHGGTLTIGSVVDQGTTMTVRLPATDT